MKMTMLKDLELEDITYQMVVKNYNVIINSKKNVMTSQLILV